MAIIGKIREKSTLLIVVIGLAMAAFILGDLFRGGFGADREPFAEVWGEPLTDEDQREYQELEQEQVDNVIQNARRQGTKPSPAQLENARKQAWENFIRDKVLQHQVDLLGIDVSKEELTEIVHGRYIAPELKSFPIFQDTVRDSTGRPLTQNGEIMTQFNPNLVTQWIQNLNQLPQESFDWWIGVEQSLKEMRAFRKYFAMIRHSIYATTAEAKAKYEAVNKKREIRFAVKKFSENSLSDTALGLITDEDWDEMTYEFYKKHKDDPEYEQPGSRVFEYVTFDIELSEKDKEITRKLMESIKNRFESTENDSLFAMQKSDSKQWTGNQWMPISAKQFPGVDTMKAADSGDVVGPVYVEEAGRYYLSKILEKRTTAEERRAKHMLIAYAGATRAQATRTQEEAKALADSLWAEFQVDTTGWHEAVATIGDNSPGTKNIGGDLGYFKEGNMAPEFGEFVFNNPEGSWGLVETDFGYHIINVTEDSAYQVRAAVVDVSPNAGEETRQKFKDSANVFVRKAYEDTSFHKLASEFNLPIQNKEVRDEAPVIQGFEENSKLLRWLRNAQVGGISDPYTIGNEIVIAKLTKIKPKGTPDFEDVKMRMRVPAKQDVLAKRWIDEVKGYNSLEEAAAKWNTTIVESKFVTFDNTVVPGGGGQEPRVIGAVFSNVQDGYLFPEPIDGKYGVYVVEVVSTQEAPQVSDYSAQREELHQQLRGQELTGDPQQDRMRRTWQVVFGEVYQAIKEKANVVDNRDNL